MCWRSAVVVMAVVVVGGREPPRNMGGLGAFQPYQPLRRASPPRTPSPLTLTHSNGSAPRIHSNNRHLQEVLV